MKRPLLFSALLLLASPAALAGEEPSPVEVSARFGVSAAETLPSTPEQRATARQVGLRILSLCPNCPRSNVSDGSCYWSRISRVVILNALVRGYDEETIVKTYNVVYGPQVLASGTERGLAMAAWILPYVVGGLGFIGILLLGRRLKRRQAQREATAPPAPATDTAARAELAAALDALD